MTETGITSASTSAAPATSTSVNNTASGTSSKKTKSQKPKAKGVSKPKLPSTHPGYGDMVKKAISELKDKKGTSKAAILKYVMQNYEVGDKVIKINAHLRQALKRGVATGLFKQVKGVGASGSFRLGDKSPKSSDVSPKKKPAVKKNTEKAKKSPIKKTTVEKSPSSKKGVVSKTSSTGDVSSPSTVKQTAKKFAVKKASPKKLIAKKPPAVKKSNTSIKPKNLAKPAKRKSTATKNKK